MFTRDRLAEALVAQRQDAEVGRTRPQRGIGDQGDHGAVGGHPQPHRGVHEPANCRVPDSEDAKQEADDDVLDDDEAIAGQEVVLLNDPDHGVSPWRI